MGWAKCWIGDFNLNVKVEMNRFFSFFNSPLGTKVSVGVLLGLLALTLVFAANIQKFSRKYAAMLNLKDYQQSEYEARMAGVAKLKQASFPEFDFEYKDSRFLYYSKSNSLMVLGSDTGFITVDSDEAGKRKVYDAILKNKLLNFQWNFYNEWNLDSEPNQFLVIHMGPGRKRISWTDDYFAAHPNDKRVKRIKNVQNAVLDMVKADVERLEAQRDAKIWAQKEERERKEAELRRNIEGAIKFRALCHGSTGPCFKAVLMKTNEEIEVESEPFIAISDIRSAEYMFEPAHAVFPHGGDYYTVPAAKKLILYFTDAGIGKIMKFLNSKAGLFLGDKLIQVFTITVQMGTTGQCAFDMVDFTADEVRALVERINEEIAQGGSEGAATVAPYKSRINTDYKKQ